MMASVLVGWLPSLPPADSYPKKYCGTPIGFCMSRQVDQKLSRSDYCERLESFLHDAQSPAPCALQLALFRRRELLRIAIRDRTEAGTLTEITEELSNLADAILSCALGEVLAKLENRYGPPLSEDADKQVVKASIAVLCAGQTGRTGTELQLRRGSDVRI